LKRLLKHTAPSGSIFRRDIKGCFDNIDHDLLLDIIGRDIHDERFLKLLRGMLKAGYMEDWHHHQTYSGTVQGGVVSPILSNIVLNELDRYVADELIPQYTRGKRRRRNPEWRHLSYQMTKVRRDEDIERYRQLERQRRTLPSQDPYDEGYRRLKYCRYADDFILGFTGPRSEAEEIKTKIAAFLKSIRLSLSDDKRLITHTVKDKARFLGYEIYVTRSDSTRCRGESFPAEASTAHTVCRS
jgi:retron-type reverse transcriptase